MLVCMYRHRIIVEEMWRFHHHQRYYSTGNNIYCIDEFYVQFFFINIMYTIYSHGMYRYCISVVHHQWS